MQDYREEEVRAVGLIVDHYAQRPGWPTTDPKVSAVSADDAASLPDQARDLAARLIMVFPPFPIQGQIFAGAPILPPLRRGEERSVDWTKIDGIALVTNSDWLFSMTDTQVSHCLPIYLSTFLECWPRVLTCWRHPPAEPLTDFFEAFVRRIDPTEGGACLVSDLTDAQAEFISNFFDFFFSKSVLLWGESSLGQYLGSMSELFKEGFS